MSSDLADRVKGLDGPCRETDALVAKAVGWTTVSPPRDSDRPLPHLWVAPDGSQHMAFPPHWTGSIDAVVALIEKELPGRSWSVGVLRFSPPARAWITTDDHQAGLHETKAATPALALLSAFLRARAALLRAKEADHG